MFTVEGSEVDSQFRFPKGRAAIEDPPPSLRKVLREKASIPSSSGWKLISARRDLQLFPFSFQGALCSKLLETQLGESQVNSGRRRVEFQHPSERKNIILKLLSIPTKTELFNNSIISEWKTGPDELSA